MEISNSHIRSFLAIVDNGSITSAADELGLVKSGLSQQLKQLEARLGTTLLIRTTRKQSLTVAGEQYYRYCKELQNLSLKANEHISSLINVPSGKLRITAPHVAMRTKIAPAIATLLSTYPNIKPEIIIDDKRLDLIEHGIDLAVSVGKLPDSDYKSIKIGELVEILSTSPKYWEALNSTPSKLNTIEQIQRGKYIGNAWQGKHVKLNLTHQSSTRDITLDFNPSVVASNLEAVKALTLEGVGLAYLPVFTIKDEISSGRLIQLLPDYTGPVLDVHVVHPYGKYLPIGARRFIDILNRVLKE